MNIDYTNLISEEIPLAVDKFVEMDDFLNVVKESPIEAFRIMKDAYDAYTEDYKMLPDDNNWKSDNLEHDYDKARFYKKYRPFVDRCNDLEKQIHISGYGRFDYLKVKVKDMIKDVLWYFPFGYKTYLPKLDK